MAREPLGRLPRAIPFVGRAAELALIAARQDEGAAFVTLLGPGGIGKTALAVELGLRRVSQGERTSIVFCDLAGARDVAMVVDAMAAACGALTSAETDDGAAHVGAALATQGRVMVVIDNLDALAGTAGPVLAAWAAVAVEAHVLVTSRERVGWEGEVVIEVGPLAAAGTTAGAPDAVALLVAAAQRRSAGFVLPGADAAAAAELVAMLEGVPLGLELAGARLPLRGAPGLLASLRDARDVLARDTRGGPARHASLDAAVRDSFEALDLPLRDALAQLTVFRGGFTVATAAGVVLVPDAPGDVASLIDELRGRSLVRTRDAGAARFDLYDAVRRFVERMHPAPIAMALERHATAFVAAAERASAAAHRDPSARAWLAAEHGNVLAVAERVLQGGPVTARSAEPALRAIVALGPTLLARGPLAAVAALIGPVVERTRDSGADPRFSARATLLRGALRREGGDVRAALKDLLGAESIARALGDALLGADIRVELGRTLLVAGEIKGASEHFLRAGEAFATLGAREREARALAWRAVVAVDLREARVLVERAVALAVHDLASRPSYLVLLGRAQADLGDGRAARRALEDAVTASIAFGEVRAEASAHEQLGLLAHAEDDRARAARSLALAQERFEGAGLSAEAARVRGELGALAAEEGRAAEAYVLLADAADAARRAGPATSARGDLLDAWPARTGEGSLAARRAARSSQAATAKATMPDDALVVGPRGAWFRAPGGGRVGLERRASLALLLDRLAAEHGGAGATLAAPALFAAAWPGERALASAAAHRVRVAVATLRKLGLREAIVTAHDGYAIARDLRVLRT